MKIAIIGSRGALGSDLFHHLSGEIVGFNRPEVDITKLDTLIKAFEREKPDIVINTAAYHNVDECESNRDLAYQVNVEGAENVAIACKKFDATLVHISTDYVFGLDQDRRIPYTEEDKTDPCNYYGLMKSWGEQIVRMTLPNHFIIRVCGLYGVFSEKNFVDTMIRLAQRGKTIEVVADQFCTSTSTRDITDMLSELIYTNYYDTYHMTAEGEVSWHEFAGIIFELCPSLTKKYGALEKVDVRPCTTEYYRRENKQLALRPKFSVLANVNINQLPLTFTMPPYFMGLGEYLGEKHRKIFKKSAFAEMFFNIPSQQETDDEEETSN